MELDSHIHTLPTKLTEEIVNREAYRVKKVVDTAATKGLDAIVLTDFGHINGFRILYHNRKIDGKWLFDREYEIKQEESAVTVDSRNYKKKLKVFLGEEIPTKQGEILGLFIRDQIEPNKDINEAIYIINQQGGVTGFPHSCATFPGAGGIGEKELRRQLCYATFKLRKERIIAVEVFNGQLAFPTNYFDKKARKIAEEWGAFQFGNSDARGYVDVKLFGKEYRQYERVGSVYTDFVDLKGVSKEEIRDYIKKKGKVEIKGDYNNLAVVLAMMAPVAFKTLKRKVLGK